MRKGKKLNNKGFTLIELLAVIVILAVVMVIASTSVLNSMNASKKSSLLDSAKGAKASFDNKYAEMALVPATEILGLATEGTTGLFSGSAVYLSNVDTAALNINSTDYDLGKSFVKFNPSNSTFLVCFVGTGSFSVASAAATKEVTEDGQAMAVGDMWACSNGDTSWTTGKA